jgi:hypothetical protein
MIENKKELARQREELFEKISSLDIYYENTSDLMRNFLDHN